jgi:enoyl-CoA hydratase
MRDIDLGTASLRSGGGPRFACCRPRTLDAAQAQRIGLVVRVAGHDQLRAAALDAVGPVLRTAPAARAHVKRMINDLCGAIDYQAQFWSLADSLKPRERMRAFTENRQPNWIPAGLPGRP